MPTDQRSEREKMLAGDPYDSSVTELVVGRLRARHILYKYNNLPPPPMTSVEGGIDGIGDEGRKLIADLLNLKPEEATKVYITPPFNADYGSNIELRGAKDLYCNFGCVFLDCAKISIGERCIFAPNVHLYAATHSLDVEERRTGLERAYPITIGDDVWIGGNVTVCGPANIGDGVVIAAGAVVKGDVEPYVLVGGVPARVIKKLDKPKDYKDNRSSNSL